MEIKDALKKPFTDLKNLLIGTVLNLLPILNFFSLGYAIECSGIGKEKASKTLPEWTDWGELFVKGFFAFLITLIYGLPAIILTMIFFGETIIQLVKSGALYSFGQGIVEMQLVTSGTGFAAGMLVISLTSLFISYILPAAVLGYLKHNSFKEAFDFQTIFRKTFNKRYLFAWVMAAIIGLAIGFVISLTVKITLVYTIISAAGVFIQLVIMYTLIGDAYAKIKV